MLSLKRTLSSLPLSALGLLLLLSSCEKPEDNALYDPNATYKPPPAITGVLPGGGAVAGIDTVIVQGTNFSTVAQENLVFFNAQKAPVLSATATQIALKAPLVTSDSIGIRVAVTGALTFSNTAQYSLKAAAVRFGGMETNQLASSLATDASGNLLAGYSSSGIEAGILKFTPAGARSPYASATSGVVAWTGLKMGPAGYLYAGRNFRALYRFSPGGGSSGALWVAFPVGTNLLDFDFDEAGNLWGGGNNSLLYCVDQNKVTTTTPFVGNVRTVRVYNGYLYFAARTDAGEKIWRAQISGKTLGTPETYYDFGAAYPTSTPLSMTFSSDGYLYIGTDLQDGLVVVSPGKSASTPFGAYRDLFGPGLASLAWGKTDDLYATTSNGILLKLAIRGKTSAPYYGSTK